MRVLELFSGTKSVGKVAKQLGWDVVSLDLHNADINIDILEWDYETQFPKDSFDIIWASFPCETFSVLRRSNLGRKRKDGTCWTREAMDLDMETNGLSLLRKSEEIIKYYNPKYYFLENPATGFAKNYIDSSLAKHTYILDYCQYAPLWGYRKRTAIWTNLSGFIPRLCTNLCEAKIKDPKTGRFRHRLRTDSGNPTRGFPGTKREERYRIPPKLLSELFALIS